MMNMEGRAALIEELEARGFKPGKAQAFGWTYTHKKDGFLLEFNASGQFKFVIKGQPVQNGVIEKPEDVLQLIDKAAEAM
jgi:hypothetical protein